MKSTYLLFLIPAALSACGGGSGESTDSQMPPPVSVVSQDTNSSSTVQDPSTTTQDPSTSSQDSTTADAGLAPAGQKAINYTLTFREEFNGATLNSVKWNSHQWWEPNNTTTNYSVGSGFLKIWPQKDANGNFFDRTLTTDGKFEQLYGYFEAEMKLPVGKGTWPAFWLYAHPGDDRPEIDVMEAYAGGGVDSGWSDANLHPNNFGLTLHKANGDYSWHVVPYATKMRDFSPFNSTPVDLSAAFHKYGVKWTASGITFYFDGKQIGPTYTDTDGYFSKPMYINVDLALGGASGTPDATTPTGPSNSVIVNYVRAWKIK